jgi:DNA-binding transcriptional LysR family regulator
MYGSMNIRQIRAFLEIVDSGTLARASARLHLSQPALSRQIDALEHELRVSLFEPSGRKVKLTSEGALLLDQCRQLLAEFLALGERARLLKSGSAGLLRIGASPTATEAFLANFLSGYRKRWPGIDIHLIEAGGSRLKEVLSSGDIDLAIFPGGDPAFQQRPLYPWCELAIIPASHPLGRRRSIEVVDLANEPLLLLSRDFVTRQWFDAACRVAGIEPLIRLESSNSGTLNALASIGFGIAIVATTMRFTRRRVRIVPIIHRGQAIGSWVVAAWRRDRFQPAYARSFVDELSSSIATGYPLAELIEKLPPLPKPGRQ